MQSPLTRHPGLIAWGAGGFFLFCLVAFGGRRPYVPNNDLWAPIFVTYFVLLLCLLAYVLFGYRQSDPRYKYGWKRAQKEWLLGRKMPAVQAVLALPVAAAVLAWFLLMPTEVVLGAVAQAIAAPTERLSATCLTSYRNKLRGPVNELKIGSQMEIKLFGYDYLCGNRVGAPIPNAVHEVVLVARSSALGLWVTRVEFVR
jgi:hypothetical protein